MNSLSQMPNDIFNLIHSYAQSSALGNTCRDLNAQYQESGAIQDIAERLGLPRNTTQNDLKNLNEKLMAYYNNRNFNRKDIPGANLGIRAERFERMIAGIERQVAPPPPPPTSAQIIRKEMTKWQNKGEKISRIAPLCTGLLLGTSLSNRLLISGSNALLQAGAIGTTLGLAICHDADELMAKMAVHGASAITGLVSGLAIGMIADAPLTGVAIGVATSLAGSAPIGRGIGKCVGAAVGCAKVALNYFSR